MTNQIHAEKIARDWNTKDEQWDYTGYVLSFAVDADYLSQFPIRTVGTKDRKECAELESREKNLRIKLNVIAIARRELVRRRCRE